MLPRPLGLLALAALIGCSGPKSSIRENNGEFPAHRCVGVAPFIDPGGRGQAVADAIEAGLQAVMYEPVDQKALAEVLAAHKPERGSSLGLEALESIRARVPVDAIIFGRIAPDWSAASITVVETEMGGPILSAVLRPRGGKKTAFADPDDLAREALRVLTSAR